MAPCGPIGSRGREIDADAVERAHGRHGGQGIAAAAAELDADRVRWKVERRRACGDGAEQRLPYALGQQRGPGVHRRSRIAGDRRAAILRLQQIDVPASRDVVGVALRALETTLDAFERTSASAHRAGERESVHGRQS
jgi:hypothetical protein